MTTLQYANRVADRLERRVGNLLGTSVSAQLGLDRKTDIAATSGSLVGLNPEWLKNASRKEVRGVLAHELTHVAQGASGFQLGGAKQEALADAVRGSLGLGKGEGYGSRFERRLGDIGRSGLQDVYQKMAAGGNWQAELRRQEMQQGGGQTGPKLPGQGKFGGRKRNTFAQLLSHNQVGGSNPGGAAALPSLDPASTANYYAQLSNLYSGYQQQLMALRQQRTGLKAGLRPELAGIKQDMIGGLAAEENAGIERGVSGSSASLQNLAGIRGQAESQAQAAKLNVRQGLADIALQRQAAGTAFSQGALQLEAQKLAQQQAALADQLSNNLIVSGQENTMDIMRAIYRAFSGGGGGNGNGGGNGGGGGGAGTPGITVEDLQKLFKQNAPPGAYTALRAGMGAYGG